MAFDAAATFEQTPGCEVTAMEDGVVVYHGATETMHYLNPSAGLIFDLCAEGRSLGEIAAYLQENFALHDAPEAEIGTCIDQFIAAGLITPA